MPHIVRYKAERFFVVESYVGIIESIIVLMEIHWFLGGWGMFWYRGTC